MLVATLTEFAEGKSVRLDQARVQSTEAWWSTEPSEVLTRLNVSAGDGLAFHQVQARQKEFGPNRLREAKTKSSWEILWNQLQSLILLLLVITTIVSLFFAQWIEAMAIVAVIVVNVTIGFVMELRAVRSMEALRRLGGANVIVRRNGKSEQISAEQLVPGDIVVLDAGDLITADLRIIESSKLQANESTLTGESVPVSKRIELVPAESLLADRKNMLFKGTFITRGSGLGVVVGTGMNTELGRIAFLVEKAMQDELTPLEKRLSALGRELVWITLVITSIVIFLGVIRGKELFLMIETGVALAVSAIPEGLPIVATLALARGMLRMVKQNVLIRRLSAVETLGATSVICTDKTGTVTENRMTVTRIVVESGVAHFENHRVQRWQARPESDDSQLRQDVQLAAEIGSLCNNATFNGFVGVDIDGTGDPMELALLVAAHALDVHRESLISEQPEAAEIAFDPDLKMMATFHQRGGEFRLAVKGAPENVLQRCTKAVCFGKEIALTDTMRQSWLNQNTALAENGLRVLALATSSTTTTSTDPYHELTFAGLVAMEDPPRLDVAPAIATCKDAGIKLVMITGDQAITARKIALDIGLIENQDEKVVSGAEIKHLLHGKDSDRDHLINTSVFARVSPEEKLDLISLHQENGAIVAMTGDGVNDAPALEKADIGVAMGHRGTQVARDAADMILQDDALSSIVTAVQEGRVIFGNIRKFVLYLLSCNASEVLVIGVASMMNWPLPLLPLHILFLNLVTDVFPALALGAGKGEATIMERKPRQRDEPILHRKHWVQIAVYATVMTIAVLSASYIARQVLTMSSEQAVTVSFLTLALAQLWQVFNMRDAGIALFKNEITTNPFVWYALILCVIILLGAVLLPGISIVLHLSNPGWSGWMTALGLSVAPVLFRLIVWR